MCQENVPDRSGTFPCFVVRRPRTRSNRKTGTEQLSETGNSGSFGRAGFKYAHQPGNFQGALEVRT